MGQLALGIAGGILGSLVGAPELGFLAGSLIGGALFGNGASRGGPRLSDLHVTSSTYGAPIPWGWGTMRVGGNIIWSYPLTEHAHSSGKGMGTGTYTYSWTGAVGLCSTEYTGPISRVLKIWADTKLVYDCTGQSGVSKNIPGSGGGKGGSNLLPGTSVINGDVSAAFNKVGKFRVYTGTQDQLPDAALEALVGTANAQAHRGTAYIVFEDVDLTNYGNRVPNWTFEVAFSGSTFTKNAFKFDPDTSVLSAPSLNTGVLDAFRHRVYFFNTGNGGDTTNGIHAFNLNDASEYMYSSYSRSFSGNSSQVFVVSDDGAIIADDGYLWMQSFDAQQWIKIDPDTLLEVGTIPYTGTITSFPIPLRLGGANYMFAVDNGAGSGGKLHLFDLDTLTETATTSIGGGLHLSLIVCGGNQVDNNTAQCFGLKGSNIGSSSIDFYSFSFTPTSITPAIIATITPGQVDSDWTNFDSFGRLVFDATDGNVMFFVQWNHAGSPGHHRQYLVKLNALTGGIMWVSPWENTPDSTKTLPTSLGSNQSVITSGIYSVMDTNNNMWTFSTQDGTSTQTLWPSNTTAFPYQVWNDSLGALLTNGTFDSSSGIAGWSSNHHQVLISGAAGVGVPVSEIVTDICAPCGLAPGDIGVSTLTDNVEGYLLTNQMSGADGIKPLALAFLFDHNVSDNVLQFVKRGGSSVRTVPNMSLALVDTKNNLFIQETRTQEVDLPYAIALNFLDPNHNYQQATQYARRIVNPYPTMYSKQTTTENLAMVGQPEFFRQLAEKLLYTAWLNRTAYKTKMTWDNVDLDPTDVVTITDTDGTTFLTRTVQQSIGADLSILMDSVAESTPTYTSAAVTDGGLGFSQQDLIPSVDTRLFLIDSPLFRDVDDTGQSYTILYDAASSYSTGTWAGTNIWKSADTVNYSNEGPIATSQACSWGSAVNALGDIANPFAIDNVNTLTLQMAIGGTNLASDTLLNVCNGANAGILLNSDGTVEIVQWLTKTLNVDGTYTLSQLLRGRRGTDVFTGNHNIGDIFILLTTSTVESIKLALSDLNMDRFYKAVTAGTLFSSVANKKFVSQGRPMKPYAPCHITAMLSGSDIDLAWVRRTRVGGELMPFTGVVPLSEQFESYEVDIYDALGDTVLRTLRVDYGPGPTSSPGVTYLAADIATDFGSTPTALNVAVYQISATVGRGFGKMQAITVN